MSLRVRWHADVNIKVSAAVTEPAVVAWSRVDALLVLPVPRNKYWYWVDYAEEDICKIQLDESDEAINKNEPEHEGLISGIADGIKNCDYFYRQVGRETSWRQQRRFWFLRQEGVNTLTHLVVCQAQTEPKYLH